MCGFMTAARARRGPRAPRESRDYRFCPSPYFFILSISVTRLTPSRRALDSTGGNQSEAALECLDLLLERRAVARVGGGRLVDVAVVHRGHGVLRCCGQRVRCIGARARGLQVGEADDAAARERREARDRVLELAHVARPVRARERVDERRLERDVAEPEPLAVAARELDGEGRDVVLAVAQRRDDEFDDGEPVVEVLAERARLGLGEQVAVGRRDDAHVDLLDPARADGLDLAFLEDAEQLGLDRERQLADLVEDQRAAVGLREEALAGRGRAGERALHVPEQLRVGELGGQGGAVEADERLERARRLRVQELGDELLAGAGLAAHEHGDVAAGDAAGGLEQAAHRLARADDAATERLLGGEPAVVDAQAARFERTLEDDRDLVDVERLREVVVGALFHRRDGDALAAVRGEQHDG